MAKKRGSADPEFSIDLVKAALGNKGRPVRRGDRAVQRVLERYKKLWRLAKANKNRRLAVAADIDQLLHVHMLRPVAYRNDCESFFGDILDHDPGPSQTKEYADILAETERLWSETFKEAYLTDEQADAGPRCSVIVS